MELDKKIQKSPTDLVQAVLEAQEKKNLERVDVLITNAIKQLKMSRFKPDQTTCISLVYLARISPSIFNHSTVIKDNLKSLVRRDNVPTNIKGKNDIVLPILASNILLACCDVPEIRGIILNKIEQWLGSNQKVSEMIQHLLITICMKCHKDQQTIVTLTEMREHWLQYLNENFDIYGPVPSSLCLSIRKLLHSETNCESLVEYLNFLTKHDADIVGLARAMSKFVVERPVTLDEMLGQPIFGQQIHMLLLKIYTKMFAHLKESSSNTNIKYNHESDSSGSPKDMSKKVSSETEDDDDTVMADENENSSSDVKVEVKLEMKPESMPTTKPEKIEPQKGETKMESKKEPTNHPEELYRPSLYLKSKIFLNTIKLDKIIVEAMMTLISLSREHKIVHSNTNEDLKELPKCWFSDEKIQSSEFVDIYEDLALTTDYNLPMKLRQKLIYSNNLNVIDLSLRNASIGQLFDLLQLFDLHASTINRILKEFEIVKDVDILRSELKDPAYFAELMEFYSDLGATNAKQLIKRLNLTA